MDCIFGHDDEVMIEKGKNEQLLNGKITYSIACEAAKSLGKAVVEKGAKSFIGYTEKFTFVHFNQQNSNFNDKR